MHNFRKEINRYLNKGILLDTGPLVLLIAGLYDQDFIERHKPTRNKFLKQDYASLMVVLDGFKTIVTTPHILTEVSNLLGQAPEQITPKLLALLAQFVNGMEEKFIPCKDFAGKDFFPKCGVADSCVLEDTSGEYLIVTIDWPLSQRLEKMGRDVFNFNRVRSLGWDL